MKEFTLFFSWQSDKNGIKKALSEALDKAVKDLKIKGYKVNVEESTRNTPGSPQIVNTILDKIDSCDIFLADISPICSYQKQLGNGLSSTKQVPNPNVLMELGYAMSALGLSYTICVAHQGQWNPNDLPFDINHNRIYQFTTANCDLSRKILDVIEYINKHGRHRHKSAPYLIHKINLCWGKIKDRIIKKENNPSEEYAFDDPIIYFCERMSKAFHGKRGLVTYTKRKDIKRCLDILFESPLNLKSTDGNGSYSVFWWFRGHSAAAIDNYKWLGGRHFLIEIMELNIRKIVAYVDPSGRYYGQYLYIETDADKATGFYPSSTEINIENHKRTSGYYSEEYGIFKLYKFIKKKVSRQEYDDGHTSFLWKTVSPRHNDSELRERFLTPYNLIISSQHSSFNCTQFDIDSTSYFNNLLQKKITIEQFDEFMKRFPKPMDRYY